MQPNAKNISNVRAKRFARNIFAKWRWGREPATIFLSFVSQKLEASERAHTLIVTKLYHSFWGTVGVPSRVQFKIFYLKKKWKDFMVLSPAVKVYCKLRVLEMPTVVTWRPVYNIKCLWTKPRSPCVTRLVHLWCDVAFEDRTVACLYIAAKLVKTVLVELNESRLPARDRDICLTESQMDQISSTKLLQMDSMLIFGAICLTLTDLDRGN